MLWLAFLAVAVCGGTGAYIAAQKHRPLFEGILFGVLLGPFGVLAAALLPERPATLPGPRPAPQPRTDAGMRIMRPLVQSWDVVSETNHQSPITNNPTP